MSGKIGEIGVLKEPPAPPLTRASARRYAWVVLVVVFLAGLATTMNQFKVPPLLPTLMKSFGVDLAAASSLMSVFAVAGAVLALPSSYILQRLGARTAGAVAIGAVAVGTIIGALAGRFDVLLLGRAIEGIGLGLVSVVAPTVIALWFPPETRGIPMGIWATWVPLGGAAMFNLAPAVAGWGGWRAVWWIGAVICVIVLSLYRAFVRMPASIVGDDQSPACAPLHDTDERAAATRRTIWLLAASFFLYNITVGSLSTFYPTFLVGIRGYTLSAAATLASFQLFAVICASPIVGMLLNRLRSRKVVLTVAILILAGAWLFPFAIRTWQIPVFLTFIGCIGAAVPTTIFAAVPEVMGRADLVGKGMAILALGQNLGFVVGPAFFSRLVQTLGWAGAGYASVPLLLAAATIGWSVRVR
jgi:predicted MFS family arabinose efflux permease